MHRVLAYKWGQHCPGHFLGLAERWGDREKAELLLEDGGGGFQVDHQSLSPRKDCSWPQRVVTVYSRVAISWRRPEPLLTPQHARPRVASGGCRGHCPGPAVSGAGPGAGFSGQPVPDQGEWNSSFAHGRQTSLGESRASTHSGEGLSVCQAHSSRPWQELNWDFPAGFRGHEALASLLLSARFNSLFGTVSHQTLSNCA